MAANHVTISCTLVRNDADCTNMAKTSLTPVGN
jgi:hypothetical protein